MDTDKAKSRATNNAYALLRQRPRSEFEIRDRLKIKGYGEPVVESVVDGLRRAGEIDDARFAKLWIDERMRLNPAGDVVLRHELKSKGIAQHLIDVALEDKNKNYDEYEIASSMAADRFERLKKLDRKKALKRIYDFLLRRGFKYDTVQKVVENIINAN